ncbi:flavin-dependent dehydrogenase [Sphingomonas sp. SORGH_AS802]|uniref:NAD(P)/FAD-dependent oxidoreductase n=1 Tax=unclassified Sphingomonas TaxID=196159 RepID=UPI00285C5468|nr:MULTISPECIES: FAD-dependent monooxygenase [unclassified Sphingomonas]MDR6128478.1 flavin-dependent dehydrogenase [Sphingomonas sp. SORGH_AS_0438]MDR6135320.1 flavin-dependent dehydrogenase [Sphingomonas sp. SORGH_AS_0802]
MQAPLIVGGGPAGAAAAIMLAEAGIRAVVLERSRDTGDALCGGFLSWRSIETLERLGVAADRLNPARVHRLRLFVGERMREAPLPRPALAVSRRRLDSLLLARTEAGAGVERGVAVRAWTAEGVRLADGATLSPATLLLATGKHELRGLARPEAARGRDPAMGLRVRLAAGPALDRLVGDAIELHLFDGGYAGLVRQEDGSANLCLAVRRSRLTAAGSPLALLHRLGRDSGPLGERLADMAAAPAIDAVANVPYGWRALRTESGLFRLGDQAGVIPSLAGEGMGIALASGLSAALAHGRGESAQGWQARFARATRRPIGLASAIWHLAERPTLAVLAVRAGPVSLIEAVARATRIKAPAPA